MLVVIKEVWPRYVYHNLELCGVGTGRTGRDCGYLILFPTVPYVSASAFFACLAGSLGSPQALNLNVLNRDALNVQLG
jgi:hypothetical protein